jgi:N-acetyl-alpha-D-glucosaminyl L-malate synthase BshA
MKIGIVCYPTYGGSGIVATELGEALAARGWEVHFISYANPIRLDKFRENIYFHEVEIPHYPLFEFHLYTLALTGKILEVIKYEQLDIIHAHYAIPHAVSGILSKQIASGSKAKLVTTLHGTDITLIGLEPAFAPIVKYSIEQSDAVTAVSQYLQNKTIQQFQIEKEIHYIPNFIDTKIYKRIENCSLKRNFAPNGEALLMHISNFRSVKRVPDTVRILKEVLESGIGAKLILIGDGPERSETEKLTYELGLQQYVKFLGKQVAIVELLSCADVFLLPSQSESFGLSALEAMACGVPVVASSIGGIPEVVKHNETGYIAEFGDTTRMARYVIDLITNKKKWQIFSENAVKFAAEQYEAEKIIPMYEELYRRLIEK